MEFKLGEERSENIKKIKDKEEVVVSTALGSIV